MSPRWGCPTTVPLPMSPGLLQNSAVEVAEATQSEPTADAGNPVRHISAKQPGIGAGPPTRAASRWYAEGDRPTISPNRRLNVPRLANPTAMQTSVTVKFADLSSSQARSTLRRLRYRPGVSP